MVTWVSFNSDFGGEPVGRDRKEKGAQVKKMTSDEIREWCLEGGIVFDGFHQLSFENRRRIEISFPKQLFVAPLELLELLEDLKARTSSSTFLLWIWDTGIWDERSDNIGLPQLELLNAAMKTVANTVAPGYLFDENEKYLCVGAAVLPMLYGWDAYLIPDSRDFFIYISHDEFIGIYYQKVSEESDLLSSWRSLNPKVFEIPAG